MTLTQYSLAMGKNSGLSPKNPLSSLNNSLMPSKSGVKAKVVENKREIVEKTHIPSYGTIMTNKDSTSFGIDAGGEWNTGCETTLYGYSCGKEKSGDCVTAYGSRIGMLGEIHDSSTIVGHQSALYGCEEGCILVGKDTGSALVKGKGEKVGKNVTMICNTSNLTSAIPDDALIVASGESYLPTDLFNENKECKYCFISNNATEDVSVGIKPAIVKSRTWLPIPSYGFEDDKDTKKCEVYVPPRDEDNNWSVVIMNKITGELRCSR